jgi:flagellar hook-length control protein FliK
MIVDLDNKLNSINNNTSNNVSNKENKANDNFKDYLKKEINNSTSNNSTKESVEKQDYNSLKADTDVSKETKKIESILSDVSNKLDEIISKEDFLGNESDIEDLTEILNLLISLLNNKLNNEELNEFTSKDGYLENLDLSSIDVENLNKNDISNLFLSLFSNTEDVNLSDSLLNLNGLEENNLNSEDIKSLLKDMKDLTDNILSNIKSETSSNVSTESYENKLGNKIFALLETLPKESIEKISSSLGDEEKVKILSVVLLEKINNSLGSIDKANNYESKIILDESNILNEDNTLNYETPTDKNLKDNESSGKYSIDENTDEDRILSKIIDGDDKSSFSKILNSYDIYNKNNVDIVKEPVVVNKQSIDLDIIKNVKFMIKNAVQELKVKIYPKELGEMTIKILSEEGIMKAEIKAMSKETYNLLNSNLQDIKKTLIDQNIKIQEVNIGIYNEDTTFFSGEENSSEGFNNNQSKENINKSQSILNEDENSTEDLLNQSNVNLLA